MYMDYNIVRTHFKNVRGVEGPAGGYDTSMKREKYVLQDEAIIFWNSEYII